MSLSFADREGKELELLMMNELLRRRADDPLFNFMPHAKQEAFIDSVLGREYYENWLVAANRSGKSDAGAYCGTALARFGLAANEVRHVGAAGSPISVKDRSASLWVSALDFPTSRDVIQPKYFDNGFVAAGQHPPFIPDREIAEWRVSDQVLKLKNGSIIGFKSAETGRKKYQGAEKDAVHFDEEHDEGIVEECAIRVGARRLRTFHTITILPPEGQIGGVSWVFPKILVPFQSGDLKHAMVFGASIYDNPHIDREEIARLEAIYPPGSPARRIRLEGEWLPGMAGARAYPSFNRQLNVKEQPEISLRRPLAWIWDFNVEPMVSLIGQRESSGLFRVHRELVLSEGSIPDMCQMFYDVHTQHYAEIWVHGDATGKARHSQSNRTNYSVIANEMRHYGAPLRMKVPESNPPVPDRVNALNLACRSAEAQINLELDPQCVELIADMEQVLRDGRGGIKKTYNARDPYFQRTHTSDALGYWISYEAPIRALRMATKLGRKIPRPTYRFRAS